MDELIEHKRSHETIVFICEKCDYNTENQNDLKRHIETVHSAEDNIRCEKCNYVTKSTTELHDHMKTHHAYILRYPCEWCKYKATTVENLREHWNFSHEGMVGIFMVCICQSYPLATQRALHIALTAVTGYLDHPLGCIQKRSNIEMEDVLIGIQDFVQIMSFVVLFMRKLNNVGLMEIVLGLVAYSTIM